MLQKTPLCFPCSELRDSVCRELRVPSISSAVKVIGGNIVIAFITYGSLGLFGYLAFLDKTEGNILQNYSADNIPIQIGICIYDGAPSFPACASPHLAIL